MRHISMSIDSVASANDRNQKLGFTYLKGKCFVYIETAPLRRLTRGIGLASLSKDRDDTWSRKYRNSAT